MTEVDHVAAHMAAVAEAALAVEMAYPLEMRGSEDARDLSRRVYRRAFDARVHRKPSHAATKLPDLQPFAD